MNKIAAVMLTLFLLGCTPKHFKVGDCVVDKSGLESWEASSSTFQYKIRQIGKENYLVSLYSPKYKHYYYETTQAFFLLDDFSELIPCNAIFEDKSKDLGYL